jgi:hypothetical protein
MELDPGASHKTANVTSSTGPPPTDSTDGGAPTRGDAPAGERARRARFTMHSAGRAGHRGGTSAWMGLAMPPNRTRAMGASASRPSAAGVSACCGGVPGATEKEEKGTVS